MAANAAVTNLIPTERGAYIKIPARAFTGKRQITISAALMLGKINSFGSSQAVCHSTYSAFTRDFGLSHSTVWRGLSALRSKKLISRDGQSGYTYSGDVDGNFYRLEEWLLTTEFEFKDGSRRRITPATAVVFSYIYTKCDNQKRAQKTITASLQEIADALSVSKKTVWAAINALMQIKLVYRKRSEGKLAEYGVNGRLLRRQKRSKKAASATNTTAAPRSKGKPQANPRNEFAAHYAALKQSNEEQAARAKAIADGSESYIFASNKFIKSIARRDIKAAEHWEKEMQRALEGLGLTAEMLRPEYYAACKKCNDTGFDAGGRMCSCWQEFKGN